MSPTCSTSATSRSLLIVCMNAGVALNWAVSASLVPYGESPNTAILKVPCVSLSCDELAETRDALVSKPAANIIEQMRFCTDWISIGRKQGGIHHWALKSPVRQVGLPQHRIGTSDDTVITERDVSNHLGPSMLAKRSSCG